ncbi:MAG: hypothetical protein P4N59_12415 [Negativicutes bacterium]|nr:hypothetical protein [Negativicutes bacterium]
MSISKDDLHRMIDALPEEFLQLMFERPDMALGEALNRTSAKNNPSLERLQEIAQGLMPSKQT